MLKLIYYSHVYHVGQFFGICTKGNGLIALTPT